ncbi:MAG: hypothetical protein OXR73_36185 [Myxococcales bacterium]|nr:hypothetical protein [Myxococcales bacterium]
MEAPSKGTEGRVPSHDTHPDTPAGVGLLPVCSDFDKRPDDAVIRPLQTRVQINLEIVPGLPCGRFPAEGYSPGIYEAELGPFQVLAEWASVPAPA